MRTSVFNIRDTDLKCHQTFPITCYYRHLVTLQRQRQRQWESRWQQPSTEAIPPFHKISRRIVPTMAGERDTYIPNVEEILTRNVNQNALWFCFRARWCLVWCRNCLLSMTAAHGVGRGAPIWFICMDAFVCSVWCIRWLSLSCSPTLGSRPSTRCVRADDEAELALFFMRFSIAHSITLARAKRAAWFPVQNIVCVIRLVVWCLWFNNVIMTFQRVGQILVTSYRWKGYWSRGRHLIVPIGVMQNIHR